MTPKIERLIKYLNMSNKDIKNIIDIIVKFKKHFLLLWDPEFNDVNEFSKICFQLLKYIKYMYTKTTHSIYYYEHSNFTFLYFFDEEIIKKCDLYFLTRYNSKNFNYWWHIKAEQDIYDEERRELLNVHCKEYKDIWEPYYLLKEVI